MSREGESPDEPSFPLTRVDDMEDVPRLNRNIVKVTSFNDIEEEKRYWLSKTPSERLQAVEINRRMVYGTDRATSRLQRVVEIVQLSDR